MSEFQVTDIDSFVAAVNRRKDEVEISNEAIDDLVGWSNGYAGKVLGPTPSKGLSLRSAIELLAGVGLSIQLVEDEKATERLKNRTQRRNPKRIRSNVRMDRLPWLFNSKTASERRLAALEKMTPRQRSNAARKAAKAKWKQRRAANCARTSGAARS